MKTEYRDWIISLYEKYGIRQENNIEIYSHFNEGIELGYIPVETDKEIFKRYCRRIRQYLIENTYFDKVEDDHDVITHNVILYKQNQRLKDINRIKEKLIREDTRIENSLVELNKEFIKLLETQSFKNVKSKPFTYKKEDKTLIVSLSDLHTGELIDFEYNKYNYKVEGERLKLFAEKIKEFGVFYKVKKILIVGLGDLVNSDTGLVLDKMLTNADNRTKIEFITVYLLSQFVLDLAENFKIDIAFVVGNESRKFLVKEMPNHETLISHNSDHTIFNILKILFRENKKITFHNTPLDEAVINVCGHNFLITHGHTINAGDSKSVDAVIRKYIMKSIKIDYILLGHIHETLINNIIIRSGSMAGSNKYAESKHYSSIASQNIIVVDEKIVTPIPINLQNTKGIEGYDYPKSIEEYNNMFDKEVQTMTTILKIVI
jgi:predicted phosphodiesterase